MGAQTATAREAGPSAGRLVLLGWAGGTGWVAGVWLQLQQTNLQDQTLAIGGCAVGLGLWLGGWMARSMGPGWFPWGGGRPSWRLSGMLIVTGAALIGFCSTDLRARDRLSESLDPALEGELLTLEGVVAALPQRRDDGLSFRFEVESARRGASGQPVVVPRHLQLGWWRGWNGQGLNALPLEAAQQPRAGQRWRFQVRLRRLHGLMNPNGFDAELWFFEQGLRAQGSVRSAGQVPQRLDEGGLRHPVERLRQTIRDAIEARLGEHTAAAVRDATGIVVALTIGDQPAIDRWTPTIKS